MSGRIIAVCTSAQKGTPKQNVGQAILDADHGLQGDAHAGKWHRQVSLLSHEKIEDFRARGAIAPYGCFGENLVVSGIDFARLPLGTRLVCGEVELEVSQIGKECHDRCQIYHSMGECIMPSQGVFARVVRGGEIAVNDRMQVVSAEPKRSYRFAVLTLSDKGSRGEREDTSGPVILDIMGERGYSAIHYAILPDDHDALRDELVRLSDQEGVDLILTTGGTGFAARDITPEATLCVCDRLCPGIPEAMRYLSMQKTSRAMLSRAVAGIRKQTLIVNLPGSRKAVTECLGFILDELEHGLGILTGREGECGRS